MFEAKFENVITISQIINSLKNLDQNAIFICDNNGVIIQVIDSACVAVAVLQLKATSFENYSCDGTINLSIRLVPFSRILRSGSMEDTVNFRYENGQNMINIIFENKTKLRQIKYKLILKDVVKIPMSIPGKDWTCIVKMPSTKLKRITTVLSLIGDTVNINVNEMRIKFTTVGKYKTAVVRLFDKEGHDTEESNEKINIICIEPVNLNFSTKYLRRMTQKTVISPIMCLYMCPNAHMVMEYPVNISHGIKGSNEQSRNSTKEEFKQNNGSMELAHVRFFLAYRPDEEHIGAKV